MFQENHVELFVKQDHEMTVISSKLSHKTEKHRLEMLTNGYIYNFFSTPPGHTRCWGCWQFTAVIIICDILTWILNLLIFPANKII